MSVILSGLSKHFVVNGKRKEVLKKLSLDIKPGEIFLLCGPNGSGKTTLLKIISTLISQSSGKVLVNGIDPAVYPQRVRENIGLIYDFERNFYQMLTLQKNLEFYGKIFFLSGKALQKRIDFLIELFSLSEYRYMKVYQCSSGIKQKAAFARAFLTDPPVILIDEFTKSLDEESRKTIAQYLKDSVKSKNKTCMVVSHDKEVLQGISDRAGRLEDGSIIEND
jgi:ABC-type multidrug transport system ATPase subunit